MKKRTKGKTNWQKVKSLTEKQVVAAAKSDPDAKPLTRAQLNKLKRVNPPREQEIDVKHIRMLLQHAEKPMD